MHLHDVLRYNDVLHIDTCNVHVYVLKHIANPVHQVIFYAPQEREREL